MAEKIARTDLANWRLALLGAAAFVARPAAVVTRAITPGIKLCPFVGPIQRPMTSDRCFSSRFQQTSLLVSMRSALRSDTENHRS
jgi:hypothetical protein